MDFGLSPHKLNTLVKTREVYGPFVYDSSAIITVAFTRVVLLVTNDDVGDTYVVAIFYVTPKLSVMVINMTSHITCHGG